MIALLCAAALAGCAGPAESSPAATPLFATEEEAFAAAEETYRAYVDALNRVDLADPETFEDVYAWTTGEANAGERESLTEMHAKGWTVAGDSQVQSVWLDYAELDDSRVRIEVCLKVSAITLIDANGTSVVETGRPDVQSIIIDFESETKTSTGLAIVAANGGEPEKCAL